MKKDLILVTGSHRSGTTWIGKVISEATVRMYVNEPFNIYRHRFCPIPEQYYFINKSIAFSNPKFIAYFESFFRINNFSISNDRKISLRYLLGHSKNKIIQKALIKDPLAFFSANFITEKYDAKTIICVRHPAAFIASLKVKNWEFDFGHLLRQPELMKLINDKYHDEIKYASENKTKIVDQGILLWNIIYDIAFKFKQEKKDWYFVKHEEISLEPVKGFKSIFDFCGLNFDDRAIEIVKEYSSNDKEDFKRNAKENIYTWKNRLEIDEIEKIKMGTLETSMKFYSIDELNY